MANDFTRMQKLAGIIKENQHKEMDESKMDGNPVKKLVNLLNQTIKIADENIPNAHNFDLEDFSQTLEGYVDELTSIGKFETYDEEMDEVKHEEDESKMDEAKKKKSISASGLITFDQLKQAVFQEYGFEDDEDVIESFKEVNDLGDLVMLLDDLGYNDEEAYEFIIKAILK
jgi:hypothetical protein